VGNADPSARKEVLWEVGAPRMDFYVILSGTIEIVQPMPGARSRSPSKVLASFDTGDVDLIFGHPPSWRPALEKDGEVLALRPGGAARAGGRGSRAERAIAAGTFPAATRIPHRARKG